MEKQIWPFSVPQNHQEQWENNSYIKAEASEQKQLYFFSHWVIHGGQIYLTCENRLNCTWWIHTKVWIEIEETFAIIQMPSASGPLGLLFNLITISETFSQRSHCHKSYWKRAMPYNVHLKNVTWLNYFHCKKPTIYWITIFILED